MHNSPHNAITARVSFTRLSHTTLPIERRYAARIARQRRAFPVIVVLATLACAALGGAMGCWLAGLVAR